MAEKDKIDLIIRGMDRQVWQAFRAQCVRDGVPAAEKVREMITKAVKKD